MNWITKITTDQWIAVAAIVVPIFIGFLVYVFKQRTKEKKLPFLMNLIADSHDLTLKFGVIHFWTKKANCQSNVSLKSTGSFFKMNHSKAANLEIMMLK